MNGYHDQTNVCIVHAFRRTIAIRLRRVIIAGRRRGDCLLLRDKLFTTFTADPDLHHAFPTLERETLGLNEF